MVFTTELNTELTSAAEMQHFPTITVKLLWNNLICIKCYIKKGDLTRQIIRAFFAEEKKECVCVWLPGWGR